MNPELLKASHQHRRATSSHRAAMSDGLAQPHYRHARAHCAIAHGSNSEPSSPPSGMGFSDEQAPASDQDKPRARPAPQHAGDRERTHCGPLTAVQMRQDQITGKPPHRCRFVCPFVSPRQQREKPGRQEMERCESNAQPNVVVLRHGVECRFKTPTLAWATP